MSGLNIECVNPKQFLDAIHYLRAVKSSYEISCLREASLIAAAGHLAAQKAFLNGASELEIHFAYLQSSQQTENDLPYDNIIALNNHGSVLHYTDLDRMNIKDADRNSFLIDAGASYHGYFSDITRTWAFRDDEFNALIKRFDRLQQEIIRDIKIGQSYIDLHRIAHFKIAEVLVEFGFINCDAEFAVESGISSTFFPHGLGHLLGLQVHDIGGHQVDPSGSLLQPPEAHPYLRLTKTIQKDFCFTIEPGLYFIDLLLNKLQASTLSNHINWSKVEAFKPYGGIRIEDDVVVMEEHIINLTREAFAQLTDGV